jgi:hypoxanthine phosphoribosyltransferase
MHCVASSREISEAIRELGEEIRADHIKAPPTVVGIANGSLFFVSDLTRSIGLNLRIEIIKARSYTGALATPARVNVEALDDSIIRGKNILLVDDILETGTTVHTVTTLLKQRGAAHVELCVLLIKEGKQKYPVTPTYCGFTIDDMWVVGYGMDLNGWHRCLPYIGVPPEKIRRGQPLTRARRWRRGLSQAS